MVEDGHAGIRRHTQISVRDEDLGRTWYDHSFFLTHIKYFLYVTLRGATMHLKVSRLESCPQGTYRLVEVTGACHPSACVCL